MIKFTYDDIVEVSPTAKLEARRGERGWVIAVKTQDKRIGSYYEGFPAGVVYLVEFEDGEAIDLHEDDLERQED
jgi:hypothetical protein